VSHRVFLNRDGFIEQVYTGDQTGDSIDQAIKKSTNIIKQMQKDGKSVLILVDSTKLGKLSTPTRKSSVEALRNIHYEKVAIYGPNPIAKAMINLIIHASGKHSSVRFFNERPAAEKWLRN